jgi:hypothetical protein
MSTAAAANAQEIVSAREKENERMPVGEAQRPITLPAMTLAPQVNLEMQNFKPTSGTGVNRFDVASEVRVGFGITNDFEVHANVAPVTWTNGVQYGLDGVPLTEGNIGPSVGATHRFLRGDFEIGASLDLGFNFINDANVVKFTVYPGLPARLHLGKSARLDTGVYVPVLVAKDAFVSPNLKPYPGLKVPVSFLYDVAPTVHFGVTTGFETLFDDFGHDIRIPIGAEWGYAIRGEKGPILDIANFMRFPAMFTPGADRDKTVPGVYVFGFSARGYLYL